MKISSIPENRGIKERSEPKVALAYSAFFTAFKEIFPKLEVAEPTRTITKYDLIIFPGGEDIDPALYGQKNILSEGVNKQRDAVERTILDYCRHYEMKILGICRGHQLINASLGGTLIQDLRYDPNVRNKNCYHESRHKLEDGIGKIGEIFTTVNSLHHQGVIRRGQDLTITSIYKGIIESCESDKIITTQFHPEFMWGDPQAMRFWDFIKKWALGSESIKIPRDKMEKKSSLNGYKNMETMTRRDYENYLRSLENNAPSPAATSRPVEVGDNNSYNTFRNMWTTSTIETMTYHAVEEENNNIEEQEDHGYTDADEDDENEEEN